MPAPAQRENHRTHRIAAPRTPSPQTSNRLGRSSTSSYSFCNLLQKNGRENTPPRQRLSPSTLRRNVLSKVLSTAKSTVKKTGRGIKKGGSNADPPFYAMQANSNSCELR